MPDSPADAHVQRATAPVPGVPHGHQPLLDALLPSMCCPMCRADLRLAGETLRCDGCERRFDLHDGLPLLGTLDRPEAGPDKGAVQTSSIDYQQQYEELAAAREYNEEYRDKLTKRWSTQREFSLLHRLLGSQPRCGTLLDIPCGGGRLSETLAAWTDTLIEVDAGLGQLLYSRERCPAGASRLWMTASAFHIPWKDASIDAAVCVRLSHHLPTAAEREQLVSELLRVARRFVVMTFFDYHSPKNYLRRIRAPFNHKPPKMTMTRSGLAALAQQHGATLVQAPALSLQSSGHRYALMVKR